MVQHFATKYALPWFIPISSMISYQKKISNTSYHLFDFFTFVFQRWISKLLKVFLFQIGWKFVYADYILSKRKWNNSRRYRWDLFFNIKIYRIENESLFIHSFRLITNIYTNHWKYIILFTTSKTYLENLILIFKVIIIIIYKEYLNWRRKKSSTIIGIRETFIPKPCVSGYSSLEPSLWFHAFRTSARAFESSTQNTRGVSRDGEKRREQRAKRIEGEGLTRGKVNTRGFAMDIVKARAKLETSPSLVSFFGPMLLRGLHLTPSGYSIPRDLSDSLIFTSLGGVLRTGAATETC